jgi:hypothetical protein
VAPAKAVSNPPRCTREHTVNPPPSRSSGRRQLAPDAQGPLRPTIWGIMFDGVSTNAEPDRLPVAAPEHRPSAAVTDVVPIGSSGETPAEPNADDASELEGLADEACSNREAAGELIDASAAQPIEAPAATALRRRPAPAEGERASVVGYLGQYEFAAARSL